MVPLALPSVVKFRPDLWNSQPLDEDYLATILAKGLYKLDEADCRLTLLNVFSILQRYTILDTEMQKEMSYFMTVMLCLLAINIRSTPDVTPLLDLKSQPESVVDGAVKTEVERPIACRKQLSIELQNCIRSVEHFDIIGPAIAWGILQHFFPNEHGNFTGSRRPKDDSDTPSHISSVLDFTVYTELERWRRLGFQVETPRGCLRFLERRLVPLEDFRMCPKYTRTLVKYTALFFKTHTPTKDDQAGLMFRQQLARFTRIILADGLGPWILVDNITNSQPQLVQCLLESLDACSAELAQGSPEVLKSLAAVRHFGSTIATQMAFTRDSYMSYCVYSTGMLSYLNTKLPHNQMLIRYLQGVKDRLDLLLLEDQSRKSNAESDESKINNEVGENIDTNSISNSSLNSRIERAAAKIAELYRSKSQLLTLQEANGEEGDTSWRYADFWDERDESLSVKLSRASKKRRNKKRR